MTETTRPYPLVSGLIDRFGEWLNYRRAVHEMQELAQSEGGAFEQIAHDLGVTPSDLGAFVRQGPHAADELPKLLSALGIDEGSITRAEPRLLADMQRVCSYCHAKGQCQRDIASGTIAQHFHAYCDNAGTLDSLQPRAN